MPANPLRIQDLKIGDENLSEEARKIANEAAAPLKAWVDKALANLIVESTEAVEKATAAMRTDIADTEKLLLDAQSRMEKLQTDLRELKVTFDHAALTKSVTELVKATDEAVKELAEKRQQFRNHGRKLGEVAITALKTALL